MNLKDQNLDLTQTERIHFFPFQFIFICWDESQSLSYPLNMIFNTVNSRLSHLFSKVANNKNKMVINKINNKKKKNWCIIPYIPISTAILNLFLILIR